MTDLIEHHIVPIACMTGPLLDTTATAAEIVRRVGGVQSHTGNESTVASELALLVMMPYSELHLAWRRHYRAVAPKKISRDILELGLARKIQENKLGGLGAAVKRQIAELAGTMEAKSDLAKPRTIALKHGTRLLRAWDGITHEVLVVEDGFLWKDKNWRSLSAIAREITGTRWSGPRFFGLTNTNANAAGAAATPVQKHE